MSYAKVEEERVGPLAQGYVVLIHPPDDPDHFMVLLRTASRPEAEMFCESLNLNIDLCLDHAREAMARLIEEHIVLSRRREGEPDPMDMVPVLDAYAGEAISSGRARDFLRMWVRGATREEMVAMLPEVDDEVDA